LGSTVLDDADLSAHSSALSQIGSTLGPDGTLQLYSCDTASGAAGQQFIADLSHMVNADVAASTHDIGLTASGENWSLDMMASPAGEVAPVQPTDVADPFTPATEAGFSGTLATTPTTEIWYVTNGATDNQQQLDRVDNANGSNTASNSTLMLGGVTPK